MARDYGRDMYRQMTELFEKVDALNATIAEMKAQHAEELSELRKQHRVEMAEMKAQHAEELAQSDARITALEKENELLREEVSRLKSDRNNNSGNSSNPPSSDQKGTKKANEYNSRTKSGKAKGAQKGHKGITLTKEAAETLISSGKCRHVIKEVGDPASGRYTTKYEIDVVTEGIVTEYRIYQGADEAFACSEVFYGPRVKALAVELYGVGVVSFKRIQEILWSITDKAIMVAAGTLYRFCRKFSEMSRNSLERIEEQLLDGAVAYTDVTVMTIDGVQGYIRNVSNDRAVRYYAAEKKDLRTMEQMELLSKYAGVFVHDHETSMYHFGADHAECNAHILRYLLKNTEDTGNSWSGKMADLLLRMNEERDLAMQCGENDFTDEAVENYRRGYSEILAKGREENRKTSPRWAKRDETSLLNRMEKYKDNYLLFLERFDVAFTNNMSERDLRKCKNRQKVAGGFRNIAGCRMFADILSIIESAKRRDLNPYAVILRAFQSKDPEVLFS